MVATQTPAPAPKAYYKKLEEKKPEPTCADIKDDMCPAMTEFENCGYCILQKYPLVGYGCPVEKTLVAKSGKKGEYEVVSMPMCDCPEGALYIDDPTYCPTCNLALMELLACSGVEEMPEDISTIEITASCVEKVMVPVEFLVECGFIKPTPSPVVLAVEKEAKKDPKKYMVVDPKVEEKKDPVVVYVKPEEKEPEVVSKAPKPVSAVASAHAKAHATVN